MRLAHFSAYSHARQRGRLRSRRGRHVRSERVVSQRGAHRDRRGPISASTRCSGRATRGSHRLGAKCLLAPGVVVTASNYGIERGTPVMDQPKIERDIVIGDGVWLGANVVVTAGVTIGAGADRRCRCRRDARPAARLHRWRRSGEGHRNATRAGARSPRWRDGGGRERRGRGADRELQHPGTHSRVRAVGARAPAAPRPTEIVVVDNDSADGSADALEREFPERDGRPRPADNLGFARAVNLGAAATDRRLSAAAQPRHDRASRRPRRRC